MARAHTCRLAAGIVASAASILSISPLAAQSPRFAPHERGLDVGASVILVDYHGGTLDLGLGARSSIRLTKHLAVAADAAYVAAREGPLCPPFPIPDGCSSTRIGLLFVGGGLVALLPRESMMPYGGVSHGWRYKKSPHHDWWARAFSPSLYVGMSFPVEPGSLFAELRVRGERDPGLSRMRWPGFELAFGITRRAL